MGIFNHLKEIVARIRNFGHGERGSQRLYRRPLPSEVLPSAPAINRKTAIEDAQRGLIADVEENERRAPKQRLGDLRDDSEVLTVNARLRR